MGCSWVPVVDVERRPSSHRVLDQLQLEGPGAEEGGEQAGSGVVGEPAESLRVELHEVQYVHADYVPVETHGSVEVGDGQANVEQVGAHVCSLPFHADCPARSFRRRLCRTQWPQIRTRCRASIAYQRIRRRLTVLLARDRFVSTLTSIARSSIRHIQ
jgi:hypothetical protein